MKIDTVNEEDELVGQVDENEIHKKGLLHRAVHIFIINSDGKLFCRQRSFQKTRYPGYWSTSVGAHVKSGKSYDETAHDALKNTLGFDCELNMIGKARINDKLENEISATYIGHTKGEMKFNPKEIEGGKFMTIIEIKKLIKQKNVTPHLAHSLKIYLNNRKNEMLPIC